ncbi:hypothetical protein P4O66_019339 [Electrophorus voltai]|uniref:V-type proton ATPase subunit C n=1 Tax=Electrophorus voltai TaxID=2609070 RepID=A0AAD8ZUC2_9TELE|nr:hypothetical protein P4O66_019339 [Electrophorus voltai]
MSEFWLISAPGEKNVGTLDVLVSLSGELAKLDTFLESIVKKVAQYMADILEDNRDKVQENLLSSGSKASYSDWQKTYEMLSEMVVPRSSILLSEDQHSGLFSVTLFRKAKDDFKLKAKEKKVCPSNLVVASCFSRYLGRLTAVIPHARFIVRDFQYNEEKLKADKEEITQLSTDKKKQLGPLVRWLKVTFSEAFIVWIHTKALRVFTESILRYGMVYQSASSPWFCSPIRRAGRRELLHELYKHLDSSDPVTDASIDIPGLNLNQQEYPYVYYKIDCNFFDFK